MKKLLALTAVAVMFGAPASYAMEKGGHEGHHPKGGMMFEKLDLNNDGEITREEFMSFHETKFTEMDADNSGVVSKDEAEAMKAKWKEKMSERRAEHKKAGDHDVEKSADTPAETTAE